MSSLKRHPHVVANFCLVAFSLLVSALLGEVLLRLTMKDRIQLFPRYHSAAVYGDYSLRRFRPSMTFWHTSQDGRWEFRINAQGFRADADFAYAKPPGRLRVLSLGDSHTAGFEVRQEQTFSEVARTRLVAAGLDVEVLNSGVSGFSTAEELIFLENEGIKYAPDLVVLGFFANDLEDNVKAALFGLEDGRLVEKKRQHLPGVQILTIINRLALLRWLSENSYLYSFVLNAVWEAAKQALLSRQRAEVETSYAIPSGRVGHYETELAKALIDRLYRFCMERSILLIVLDIPAPSMAGSELIPSIPDDLIPFIEAHSDVFLDSRKVFTDFAGNYLRLHVAHGHRHISELTHRVLGELIAEHARRVSAASG